MTTPPKVLAQSPTTQEQTGCTFDPSIYTDVPLVMFHCPACGEMAIAGMPHPNYSLLKKGRYMTLVSLTYDQLIHLFELWNKNTLADPTGFDNDPLETYGERAAEYFMKLLDEIKEDDIPF